MITAKREKYEKVGVVFRALVSLHIFSVLWNLGCLQKSENPPAWAESPHGGCGSPAQRGTPRGSPRATLTAVCFLSPASHYYKYKQQFIFPGEARARPPWSDVREGLAGQTLGQTSSERTVAARRGQGKCGRSEGHSVTNGIPRHSGKAWKGDLQREDRQG